MRARRSRPRALLLAILGVTVLLLFFLRRAGLVPTGEERFDPADFQAVVWSTTAEAGARVGERAVVCGQVVSTTYATETEGAPTYLNLDRPYPDQPFDAVIWGRHRAAFVAPPEDLYLGQDLCVAGRVTTHRGVPRIEVTTPRQIEVH